MVTKMTIKNQVTIPKKIMERLGLVKLKEEERYFDVETRGNLILLKPVTLTIEERIPPQQWKKFEDWATKPKKGDLVFETAASATAYLKKKMRKK